MIKKVLRHPAKKAPLTTYTKKGHIPMSIASFIRDRKLQKQMEAQMDESLIDPSLLDKIELEYEGFNHCEAVGCTKPATMEFEGFESDGDGVSTYHASFCDEHQNEAGPEMQVAL